MAHIAKKLVKAREGIDRVKLYPIDQAVALVKERATAKFDETVEIALNLGVDPKHADQMVRGVVNLPNGTGRVLRVAVFARGAKARRGQGCRCRHRRRGGTRHHGPGRHDRFRSLYRHPGHDAARRPSR